MQNHPDITFQLALDRQRERIDAADRHRRARQLKAESRARHGHGLAETTADVRIRPARPEDARALVDLAALASSEPLSGDVLLAEVEGELWAACALATGRTLGDPFRPTVSARALLRLRRRHLLAAAGGGDGTRPRLLWRLRARWGWA